jgi:hypothetical protein
MPSDKGFRFGIVIVRGIDHLPDSDLLTFSDGSQAILGPDADRCDYYRLLAQQSSQRSRPVGVSIDASNRVVALGFADLDVPRAIVDDKRRADRKKIWFTRHAAIHTLEVGHPDYARIIGVVSEALQRKAELWVAALPYAVILDVRTLEEVPSS